MENRFAALENMKMEEPIVPQETMMMINAKETKKFQDKPMEINISNKKTLKDLEEDWKLKEILVQTSKILEVE